jgi:hypothetical protein
MRTFEPDCSTRYKAVLPHRGSETMAKRGTLRLKIEGSFILASDPEKRQVRVTRLSTQVRVGLGYPI